MPLLIFGVITVFGGFLPQSPSFASAVYWLLAVPGGFATAAWYFHRQEARLGVGAGGRQYVQTSVAAVALVVLAGALLLLFGIYLVAIALGLTWIGSRQGNRRLMAWAIGFGLLALPAGFHFWSNRVFDLTGRYISWADSLVVVLLGFYLVLGGVLAARQERS